MSKKLSFWATLPGGAVLILIAFIGYSLLKNHSMHLVQWLPFLIILLCPLMHFFMHRGHEHSNHNSSDQSQTDYNKGYSDAVRDQQADEGSEHAVHPDKTD